MSNLDEPFDRIHDAIRQLLELVRAESRSTEPYPPETTTEEDGVVHDDIADGVAPAATTTTDVDPKAGVQELEATHDNAAELATSAASAQTLAIDATGVTAPTPAICSTDGPNHDADVLAASLFPLAAHSAESVPLKVFSTLLLQLDVAPQSEAPMNASRSTECLSRDDCWVQPMPTLGNIPLTFASTKAVYLDPAGPFLCLTPTAQAGHGVHLVARSQWLLLPTLRPGIEQRPWPPPTQECIFTHFEQHFFSQLQGRMLRPRSWPSFACHLDSPYSHTALESFLFRFCTTGRLCIHWQYEQLQQGRPPDPASTWSSMIARPLDRRTYDDAQLSQEGRSWTVAQDTSCLHSFHIHAGYLASMYFLKSVLLGSEALHGKLSDKHSLTDGNGRDTLVMILLLPSKPPDGLAELILMFYFLQLTVITREWMITWSFSNIVLQSLLFRMEQENAVPHVVQLWVINSKRTEDPQMPEEISTLLDELCGSNWFSKMDLKAGYHQMILSTLKNSANTTVLLCFACDAIDSTTVSSTGVSFQLVMYPVHRHPNLGCISASHLLQQVELANEYKYSVFSLSLSIFGSEIEYCLSMLSVFGESLLHLHSVLLLLPQPPLPAPHGLQSTGFFMREFKCELLRLLPVQTVQIVVEVGDSASCSFASVVLLFGHKISMRKDLHFLSSKSNGSGLLLMASSTQNHFYPGWDRELNAVCAAVVYFFEDYLRSANLEMRQAWPPLIKDDYETASTIVYLAGMAYVDVADSETLSLSTYNLWSELPTDVIHMKQYNYKGLQSYSSYVLQLREGTECLVHCNASYEFYLAKFALVWKLDRCGSNNSALSVITSLVHIRNTCDLGYILELTWRSHGLSMKQLQGETPSCDILVHTWLVSPKSYRSCACFPDNKCRLVVQLLSQSIGEHIGSVHKRGVETNAVKSTEFKSNISLCLSIHLVRSLSIPIELKLCADNSPSEIKRGLHPLYSSTIRVWMAVLFDWPLSSYREVFTGAIIRSAAVTGNLGRSQATPRPFSDYSGLGASRSPRRGECHD